MSDNNSHAVSSMRRLPPAEDSSDRIPPPATTIDAKVVSAEVVESMPASGVRQKLDAVKSRFEEAAEIVQNDVNPRVKQAIQLLVEIDYQQGWEELGYESIRQLIQAELQPLLNMSVSQTYRRLNAAKVRQQVSHLCDSIEEIPDSQLEALSRLPSEQWQEAWAEIAATAPGGRITGKYVKSVVNRRLAVSGEQPEPEQPLQISPQSYEIGQLVLIQCEDITASDRCRRYSGCWATVQHVYETASVVAVGGEVVRYLLGDLQLIENASPVLRDVCDRVVRLWQVKNKPPLLQHLLETFYQRRLEFEQVDLVVLEAIGRCVR